MEQEILNAFRMELKKYYFYLRRKRYYLQRLELIEHQERGIVGKDLSQERVQGSSDPHLKEQRRLELIEEKIECERMLKKYSDKLDSIEAAINEMDNNVAESIRRIYISRSSTLEKEGRDKYVSKRQISRLIDAEISKLATRTLEKVLL